METGGFGKEGRVEGFIYLTVLGLLERRYGEVLR